MRHQILVWSSGIFVGCRKATNHLCCLIFWYNINCKKLSHPHRFKGLLCNRGTDNTDNWACRVTNQYPCHNHPKPSRPPSKWPWVCQQNPIARCGSCNLTAGFAAYCCNSSFSTQFVGVIGFFLNQAWAKGILHLCHILVANLAWVQQAKCLHHDQQSFPRSGATHRSSRWQTHTPWNTQALGASWPQSVEIGSGVMQVYSHTLQMYQISMSFDFGSVDWGIMLQGYLQNMLVFLYRLQPPWTVWWSGVVKIDNRRFMSGSWLLMASWIPWFFPMMFEYPLPRNWETCEFPICFSHLLTIFVSIVLTARSLAMAVATGSNGARNARRTWFWNILKTLPSQNMYIQTRSFPSSLL